MGKRVRIYSDVGVFYLALRSRRQNTVLLDLQIHKQLIKGAIPRLSLYKTHESFCHHSLQLSGYALWAHIFTETLSNQECSGTCYRGHEARGCRPGRWRPTESSPRGSRRDPDACGSSAATTCSCQGRQKENRRSTGWVGIWNHIGGKREWVFSIGQREQLVRFWIIKRWGTGRKLRIWIKWVGRRKGDEHGWGRRRGLELIEE